MRKIAGWILIASSLIWLSLLIFFNVNLIRPSVYISTISAIILLTLAQILTGLALLSEKSLGTYFFRNVCFFLLCISLISIPFGMINNSSLFVSYSLSGLFISFFQLLQN
jgi:hypothetical protein